MKKHWLFTTVLAIALCVICFTLFPMETKAAGTTSDGLTYTIINRKVTITGINGWSNCTNIVIPAKIDGYPVTTIGAGAFENNDQIETVTMANSVITIEDYAFEDCDNLKTVKLSNKLKEIGFGSFLFCRSLSRITIPSSVEYIGMFAFGSTYYLKSITIPGNAELDSYVFRYSNVALVIIEDGIKEIPYMAFENCDCLSAIYLPKSVTKIGQNAFNNCSNLKIWYGGSAKNKTKINLDGGNSALVSAKWHYNASSALEITAQPETQEVKTGSTVKFTAKAKGMGPTYRWQSSADGKTWKNCSSIRAKKATFTFTSDPSKNGNYYRCRITDVTGKVVYTDTVRLYVLGVTSQPKTQKVEVGEKVKFTVKATGAGVKYQWQYSSNGKTWKNSSATSAKKATFSFATTLSHSSNYYRCKITDSKGNVIYTDVVRLYVLGVVKQPVEKTVTNGRTAKLTVVAAGAGKVYQWQYSTDGGKTWKNITSTASAKKATLSFTTKTSHNGNYYRCRIKDSGGNTIYTNKVKLTVKK